MTMKSTKGWKVHHIRQAPPGSVYIGRPSIFGNPFPVEKYGRSLCLELYETWLEKQFKENTEVASAIRKLAENSTGDIHCYCKPRACHGDTIVKFINRIRRKVL